MRGWPLDFALISILMGITIKVMKNMRMCMDSHVAFKLISNIIGRDIVVRDVQGLSRSFQVDE